MGLEGLRVWLTGASSGIGEALVGSLVRRGARVAITARRTELLAALAARHVRDGVSPILVVPGDVTDRDTMAGAAKQIDAAWGGIDLAIFNAGGTVEGPQSGRRDPQAPGSSKGAIRDPHFAADDYTATMALNYFSVVYGLEAVLPGMLARGRGHVAAVASLAGYRALPVGLQYGASKAAVIHLLEGLRFDLEPRGVAVTVINPGFVRTPLTARNAFKMPFLIDADDAAERIARGLERGRREIHFPAPLSWTMKVLQLLPDALYGWIIKRAAPD